MGLPVTTPMLTSRDLKVLHLESTDICQAACPLCARETDPEFDKNKHHWLTVKRVKDVVPDSVIANLDKMFMCGNYGDPAAGPETIEIYDHFRKINPAITLGMNTNGGLQNSTWWAALGQRLNKLTDYVVFSIDGLEDTNHLYRKNVSWSRVVSNVQAFIAAGGRAHWDMLVYKYNEHQVDQCEKLAKDMGFVWFRAKVSKRPLTNNLEYPVNWSQPDKKSGPIKCHALEEQSAFIDARGNVSPCCWIGNRQSQFVIDFDEIKKSWNSSTPNRICQSACSTDSNKSNFTDQWRREISLL
jgi:MoaA/NifB/PqqE/SkfB family radical SAM enzyme